MGLTQTEWEAWRAHIDYIVREQGQWVGLCNGHGEPVMDLPPITELEAGNTNLDAAELTATVTLSTHSGDTHQIVDLMVANGLGNLDESGRLVPATNTTWMLVVQRPGGKHARYAYLATFPVAQGGAHSIDSLRIEAIKIDDLLNETPCPSVPALWGHEPIREWSEDAGGVYTTPRRYAPIEMATIARGYTKYGPAERAIQELIQESLDAAARVHPEWEHPHLIVDFTASGNSSQDVAIQRRDDTIWATICEWCRLAGVTVTTELWWPGDPEFPVNYEHHGEKINGKWSGLVPVGAIRVKQMEV